MRRTILVAALAAALLPALSAHADQLADRILFLDGLPNFQHLGRLRVGENTEEIIKADLALEMDAIPLLKEAI